MTKLSAIRLVVLFAMSCLIGNSIVAQKAGMPSEARSIPNYMELWANEPFSKYDPATELVEKRDQVSKHFRNADGTITAHIASGPIHYWDDGQWKTIFHTIEESPNGGYINNHNSFITQYPKNLVGEGGYIINGQISVNDLRNIKMYVESDGQTVGLSSVNEGEIEVTANKIRYKNVFSNASIDLELTQNTLNRKMDFILESPQFLENYTQGSLVFSEEIILPEGTIALLINDQIQLIKEGVLLGWYAEPLAYDKDPKKTEELKGYKPEKKCSYKIQQEGNKLTILTKIDLTWLKASDRKFPVIIDPNYFPSNIAWWTGFVEAARDPSGVSYTYPSGNIWSASARSNASDAIYLGLDDLDYPGTSADRQALYGWAKFDITSIPDNCTTISSVILNSYVDYDFAYKLSANIRPIATEPVSASAANRLSDIRDGTSYVSVTTGGNPTFETTGWKATNLSSGGVTDLTNKLLSDWYAVGYEPTYNYWNDDYVRISGFSDATYKPYINVTYSSLTAPTITTTTATSIGSTSASSGGTSISAGGGTISAKGVCYAASPTTNPTTSNLTTSDGTVTANFTSSLNSLSAETQYYYRAYATNECGTGYGTAANFWTLSTEPTGHSTTFTATAVSPSQINLTFLAASTYGADGYIILMYQGASAPTSAGITDGIAPASLVGFSPTGATYLVTISSSATSYSHTTCAPLSQYYYTLIPFNWNASNAETYNYRTTATIPTCTATTLNGPSTEGYYISGNIVNNGTINVANDINYIRMTGSNKTISGTGIWSSAKICIDGTISFGGSGLTSAVSPSSSITELFVLSNTFTLYDNQTFPVTDITNYATITNNTGSTLQVQNTNNYGTLNLNGTGIINNAVNWLNGTTGAVTVASTGTINVSGNWTNNGTFTPGTGTVGFTGSTSGNSINGATTFYNATINKGSSTATILDVNGTVAQTNSAADLTFTNGLLRIPSGGSWTKTSGGPTIGANSGLHVNGGTFTLNGASINNYGLFKTTTGTATIGNSSGNSITNQSGSSFIVDGAGTVNIAGRLEVTGSGSVNLSAGTVNVSTTGNGTTNLGSIDMTSSTSFTMSGGAINMVQKSTGSTQVDYRNLAGTVSISGGTLTIGTSATSASSNFNIQGAMPPLVVDNTTNAKTATINGSSTVYGNVTINSTSSLVLNTGITATVNGSLSNSGTYNATGTLNLAGNWVNNGTFTSNTGNTVVFNGSSASTIGGSGTDNFYNLTMSKTSASPQLEVTLGDGNISIANTLTLTLGNLVTGSYVAHVTNTASGAVSGGSSDSYVVGKLKRAVAGANTYVFPVGKSLFEEASLAFSTGYTSADITAFFTDASPGSLPAGGLTQSGTSLVGILDKGYWSIDPSAGAVGSPTYTVTLKETGHANGSTNAANYTVIKRQNTPSVGDWSIQGTHSNTTQSDVAGVVTAVRSGLTSFSDFAIGYGSAPLPIELSSFQANCSDNNTVDVTWTTASEHNTNYFRVDKSRNGTQWDVLNTIGAAGNSNYAIDYALTDFFPTLGINYYRLTQYDLDGVFETFDAQSAVCSEQQAGTALSTYPNPSTSDFNVDLQTDELEGEGVLIVTDAKGAVVHSQDIKIIKGNNNYVIHPSTGSGQAFEPGIYYITVKAGSNTLTTKHSLR